MSEVKRYRAGDFVPVTSVAASDFDAERLRADTAEAENRLLRHSNASFLETVAKVCDQLGIDLDAAKNADGQPSDVLLSHARNQAEKLASAEQRIAKLKGLLEESLGSVYVEAKRAETPFASRLLLGLADRVEAALNPNPEAESHELAKG